MRIRLTKAQSAIYAHKARFKVVCAGRRFGKSFLAGAYLLEKAFLGNEPGRLVFYIAPTYRMAKQIMWRHMKRITRGMLPTINETDLSITFHNGTVIALRGADNFDSMRGVGLNAAVLDEYADMRPEVWGEVIRPALSDKQGDALFIGTPKGYNHFYDLWTDAHTREGWHAWSFTTADGGNVPLAEIDAARADLDPRIFQQEYEASFQNLAGRVFYAFNRPDNVRTDIVDAGAEVRVGMDFNVNPMSAVLWSKVADQMHVWDEIEIPDGNTELMAQELKRRFGNRRVLVYPDPSGKARKTSAPVGQTDFAILKAAGFQVIAPNVAPLIVDRNNEVNALLCNAKNERRLFISPNCKRLIRCLEGLTRKEGTAEPDKSLGLDHLPDALAYAVHSEFPIVKRTASVGRATWG